MEWARKSYRPVVNQYRPGETAEAEEAEVRLWKANCQKQEGFDLLYKILMG
jgi:hypothetical protein